MDAIDPAEKEAVTTEVNGTNVLPSLRSRGRIFPPYPTNITFAWAGGTAGVPTPWT